MNENDPTGALPEKPDATTKTLSLSVILTCFNRKEKTLDCLKALKANVGLEKVELSAVLADDGSTDGTADAVRALFPWVQIVTGNGNLFWCRGMHKAFEVALQGKHDYYLWLNDDTTLHSDAVSRLLACESSLRKEHGKPVIVVGSTVDPESNAISYGGELQVSPLRRTRFSRVIPGTMPIFCDSMNGNIVLIPKEVVELVGNLDPVFEHAMGDTDYGLRARKLGIGIWVGPGIFGLCGGNPKTGTFMDTSLPLARRWKLMMNRKGLPWRSWLIFTRRHTGILWPLYFSWPYISLALGGYRRRA